MKHISLSLSWTSIEWMILQLLDVNIVITVTWLALSHITRSASLNFSISFWNTSWCRELARKILLWPLWRNNIRIHMVYLHFRTSHIIDRQCQPKHNEYWDNLTKPIQNEHIVLYLNHFLISRIKRFSIDVRLDVILKWFVFATSN